MPEPIITTGPEGANPEPRRTGYRALDLLLAGSAILISTISLVVGFQNAQTQERMVAATSRPILFFETGNAVSGDPTPSISMTIRNDGAGPALLRHLEVRYAGKPVTDKVALFKACCGVDISRPGAGLALMSRKVDNTILPAGSESTFLRFNKEDATAGIWEKLNTGRFKLTFDACYCSIIGECWRSDLTGAEPTRAKRCETTGGWRDY